MMVQVPDEHLAVEHLSKDTTVELAIVLRIEPAHDKQQISY